MAVSPNRTDFLVEVLRDDGPDLAQHGHQQWCRMPGDIQGRSKTTDSSSSHGLECEPQATTGRNLRGKGLYPVVATAGQQTEWFEMQLDINWNDVAISL